MLLALFAVTITGCPVAFIFNVWWLYHGGGYVKLNEGTYGCRLTLPSTMESAVSRTSAPCSRYRSGSTA